MFSRLLFCILFVVLAFSCKTDTSEKPAPEKKLAGENIGPTKADNAKKGDSLTKTPYRGAKDKILEHLTVDEIPADFPKPGENETKEAYKNRCMQWATKNLNLVKPEYRDKVKAFEKKQTK